MANVCSQIRVELTISLVRKNSDFENENLIGRSFIVISGDASEPGSF